MIQTKLLFAINIVNKQTTLKANQNIVNKSSHHQLKCFSFIAIIITANFHKPTIARKTVKNILISDVPIKTPLIILSSWSVAINTPDTKIKAPMHNVNIPSAHK